MKKKFDFHLSYEEKLERKKALDSMKENTRVIAGIKVMRQIEEGWDFEWEWVEKDLEALIESNYFKSEDIEYILIAPYGIYIESANEKVINSAWYMTISNPEGYTTLLGGYTEEEIKKEFGWDEDDESFAEDSKTLDAVVQPGLKSSVLIKVALKRLDLEYGTRWTRRSYYLGETTSSHGINGDIEANGKRYVLEGFKEDAKKFDLQEANKIVQELSKQINEEEYRDVSDENMNTTDVLLSVRIVKKII